MFVNNARKINTFYEWNPIVLAENVYIYSLRFCKGPRKKTLAVLADASAKAFTPPPLAVSGRSIVCKFFYMYIYTVVFEIRKA